MLRDHRESGCGFFLDSFYFSGVTASLLKPTIHDQYLPLRSYRTVETAQLVMGDSPYASAIQMPNAGGGSADGTAFQGANFDRHTDHSLILLLSTHSLLPDSFIERDTGVNPIRYYGGELQT